MSLPPPAPDQAFCEVSALEAGFVVMPLNLILSGTDEIVHDVPSLSFLIRHLPSNKTLVFDLGVRSDFMNYPPVLHRGLQHYFKPSVPQDVGASLRKGGLDPADVDYVIYSHLHWDHVGDSAPFTKATFLLGAESKQMCDPGYPEDPKGTVAQDLLPKDRTRWIWSEGSGSGDDNAKTAPLGPFPKALDFFGDGSVWLVDAPGHCPGNMNCILRTSADGAWLYLAGDSVHAYPLLYGVPPAAREDDPSKARMYTDKPAAEKTFARIRAIKETPRAKVIIAHDKEWFESEKDKGVMFPGKIPAL